MKYNQLGNTGIQASRIALGLMRSSLYEAKEMRVLLDTAVELGINFVDLADIYVRLGLHTCYNGEYRGKPPGDRARIPKSLLSSDWSL